MNHKNYLTADSFSFKDIDEFEVVSFNFRLLLKPNKRIAASWQLKQLKTFNLNVIPNCFVVRKNKQ